MKSLVNAIQFDQLVRKLGKITPEEKLVSTYEAVRDIPYGGVSSKDLDLVVEENRGTGTGKHGVLKNILVSMGYGVEEYFAKHDLGQYPLREWPAALQEFKGKSIPSFHHFLKVKVGEAMVTVDATYDSFLSTIGFPTLEWDGKSDMKLPVKAEETIKVNGDTMEHWKSLVQALPEDTRKQRRAFLKALKAWIEEQRSKSNA